jgi:hypothetical protein
MISISCGLCCSKNVPCEGCLKQTLSVNGFNVSVIDEVRGLSNRRSGSSQPWACSDLYFKLCDIKKNYKVFPR